jgi:putative lipoprotein
MHDERYTAATGPYLILLALVAGLLTFSTACTNQAPGPDGAWDGVYGRIWVLEQVEDRTVVDGSTPTLVLEPDGKLHGKGGVNSFFGSYERQGESGLRFSPLGSTTMAGPPALMDQEAAYLRLLERADGFRLRGGTLELTVAGEPALVFAAKR